MMLIFQWVDDTDAFKEHLMNESLGADDDVKQPQTICSCADIPMCKLAIAEPCLIQILKTINADHGRTL